MKRVLASSTPLALILTLLAATASRGQQGENSGQPQQPAQPGANQPGQGGNPNQSGQQQSGTPGYLAQSGGNQPVQRGNPNQAGQPQHINRQGQTAQDSQPNQMQGTFDLIFTDPIRAQNSHESFWRYQIGSNSAFTPEFLFAILDNASRNSGMTLAPADPALRAQLKLAENEGLIVTQVEPGSPAAAAGIHQNDLLVRMEQSSGSFTSLGNVQDLVDALKNRGEQVARLVLMRAGRQVTISVQPWVHASLGPVRPEPPTYWIGVAVSPVEPALRAQLQLPDNQGLIVVEVDPQSPAAKAGVRQFDIIRSVNGQIPPDAPSLTRMIQAHGDKTVVIELTREARPVHVELVPVRRHAGSQRTSADRAPGLSDHVLRGRMVESKLATPGGTTAFDAYGNLVGNVTYVPNLYTGPISPPADPALAKRLDDLTAQIKELRLAVEAMTKAQAPRQGQPRQ